MWHVRCIDGHQNALDKLEYIETIRLHDITETINWMYGCENKNPVEGLVELF